MEATWGYSDLNFKKQANIVLQSYEFFLTKGFQGILERFPIHFSKSFTLALNSITDNPLDIDAFSEEFDLRMRWGRGPASTCSTIPRPTFSAGSQQQPRPGSAAPAHGPTARDYTDHPDPMSQSQISQISDNTGT